MNSIDIIADLGINQVANRLPLLNYDIAKAAYIFAENENYIQTNSHKICNHQIFPIENQQLAKDKQIYSAALAPLVKNINLELILSSIYQVLADESLMIFSLLSSYAIDKESSLCLIDINQITTLFIDNGFSAPIIESENFRFTYTKFSDFKNDFDKHLFLQSSPEESIQIWDKLDVENENKIFDFTMSIAHAWKSKSLLAETGQKNLQFKSIPIVSI